MPFNCREEERRLPIHRLEVDVTSRSNKLFRDGLSPFRCREVDRCLPFHRLEVDVTSPSNKLRCHGRIPSCGRQVEGGGPMYFNFVVLVVLVVDKGLRALCTRGHPKLLSRHGFPTP